MLKHVNRLITALLPCFFLIIIANSCKQETEMLTEVDLTGLTKVWVSGDSTFTFPAQELEYPRTGVCFSGGGTRAMVCAVGQMKGLYDLGLFEDIGYISCASGGSWASVPFTYYNAGAANDEQLLGTVIAPSKLTLSGMDVLPEGFLAGAANADLLVSIIEDLGSVDADDLWINGVSKSYMEPFGVFNSNKKMYFSLDSASVADICKRQPSLNPSDFITVHDNAGDAPRPYLIANSCIVGPYNGAPYNNPEQLAVFNYTPLYVGSGQFQNAAYTSEGGSVSSIHGIGGGYIEPYAFGANAPTEAYQDCNDGSNALCINIQLPTDTFSIADASGTSSSAFAADLSSHGVDGISLKDLLPEVNYFPINQDSMIEALNYSYGDGGNLENFGLISLLQRKVNKIVVFANSGVAINVSFDTSGVATPSDVDSDFLPLFGIEFSSTSDQNQNQVFSEADFNPIMQQFIDAKNAGNTVMATSELVTVKNDWWGVPAGDTVNITWVYNENVELWRDSLENAIKVELDLGILGDFDDFPLYKLVGEDFQLVKLSARQINLLYQLSAWNVYTNSESYEFLKPD